MNKTDLELCSTGIGSLPHPYIDAALQHAFALDVPALPQLPAKGEFMIPQALRGLPGLEEGESGQCTLDLQTWKTQSVGLRERTDRAFGDGDFSAFEPDPELWSGWLPFLYELEERRSPVAKIQIAGPVTCQWVLQTSEGEPAGRNPAVGMQVFRVILAKAMAMTERLRQSSIQPLIFLDEPGLYGLTLQDPRHRAALEELRLFIQTLQKSGAWVGLHSCSNTDWEAVLGLPLDWISFDTELSLPWILPLAGNFVKRGGRLAFGLIPSGGHGVRATSHRPQKLVDRLFETVEKVGGASALGWIQTSLLTPACGLGLHRVADAEAIRENLTECVELIRRRF